MSYYASPESDIGISALQSANNLLQQMLIDSRNRLDIELARFTRMNAFFTKALYITSIDELMSLTAESIVDIFDVEIGAVWLLHPDHSCEFKPVFTGIDIPLSHAREIKNHLITWLSQDSRGEVVRLTDEMLINLQPSVNLHDGHVGWSNHNGHKWSCILLLANSAGGAGYYQPQTPEVVAIFTTFLRQVSALLDTLKDHEQIEQQQINIVKSEHLYRLLTENTGEVVWKFDVATSRLSYVSPSVEKMLGYTVDEVKEISYTDLVTKEDRTKLVAFFEQRLDCFRRGYDKDNSTTDQFSFIRKDGTRICTEMTSSIVMQDDNEIVVVGANRDITDRKKAELDLRASQTRFEQVAYNASEWIWEIDTKGMYTYCSSAVEKILGYTVDELVGKKFYYSFFLGEYLNDYQQLVEPALARRDRFDNFVNINLHKNGTPVYLKTSGEPIFDEEGYYKGYRGLDVDVTEQFLAMKEQEKLQEQLIQSQKMEVVGRLAGGVAHDFNNMLGVIIGHAEIALMHLEPNHPSRVNQEVILQAANRSAELTRQLLAFARRQTISPKTIVLNERIESLLKMIRRLIGEDIELVWKPSADLWNIRIDPTQVDQILANICVNARDAIHGNGEITIHTVNTTLNSDLSITQDEIPAGEYVLLSIADTGCGMDNATLTHIFEPFFTTKEVGKGTGLGLATVFGSVKQNQGFINVISKQGLGTSFEIYFPRVIEEQTISGNAKEEKTMLTGTETILIVEDEEEVLKLIRDLLLSCGYNVLATTSPTDAIEIAKKHSNDIKLLLTDVIMPKMNGKELWFQIRQLIPNIKSLFTSGYTADVIAEHGVLDENVSFLEKPFNLQTLTSKVRSTIDGRI